MKVTYGIMKRPFKILLYMTKDIKYTGLYFTSLYQKVNL